MLYLCIKHYYLSYNTCNKIIYQKLNSRLKVCRFTADLSSWTNGTELNVAEFDSAICV